MTSGILMRMRYETGGLMRPLEELVAVARLEHVTAAADELGVPQPTLSRSLARLSATVGAPLLRRQGRGVVLTRHGRRLAAAAERAVAEVATAVREIRAETDPTGGTVRLGFQHVMGTDLVPTALRTLREGWPDIRVELHQGGADPLVEGVAAGESDLSLVATVLGELRPGLVGRVLGTQELVLLVPRDHALARAGARAGDGDARRVELQRIGGEPFVAMAPGFGMRTITDRLLRDAGLRVRPTYECEDLATVGGLVAAGLGVGLAPVGTGHPGTVEVRLTTADGVPTRSVQLLWSESSISSPPVATLRDVLVETVPALLGRPATVSRPRTS